MPWKRRFQIIISHSFATFFLDLQRIIRGQVVDSESLAAAIRACRNGGEWQQAVALSRDVEDRGLDGTLTYSALMGAYALNAMWEEAFNLLDILQRNKAWPGNFAVLKMAIS